MISKFIHILISLQNGDQVNEANDSQAGAGVAAISEKDPSGNENGPAK